MKASSRHTPRIYDTGDGERVAFVRLPPLSYRAVRLLPALPIRRSESDLRIFRVWRISRLPCPITVLFYKTYRVSVVFEASTHRLSRRRLLDYSMATLLFENAFFQKPSS